jgi:hypothetical protein
MRNIRIFFLAASVTGGPAFTQDLPTNGVLKVAGINLTRVNTKIFAGSFGAIESTLDNFAAAFSSTEYTLVPTDPPAVTYIGNCLVQPLAQMQNNPDNKPVVKYLDAGASLNLAGPKGAKQIPAFQPGTAKFLFGAALGGGVPLPALPAPPPVYLDPGTYTVDNGEGGADVGPFSAKLDIPAPFVWTNVDAAASIDRAAGVDVAWTGGDPATKVFIAGSVSLTDPATRRVSGGGYFSCTEDNSAGHFFISPEVLGTLPASTTTAGVSNGSIIVSNGVSAKFDLPGFDQSQFNFSLGIARSPEYK